MNEIQTWQAAIGVPADGQFGPATLAASMALLPKSAPKATGAALPWMTVARQHLGLHEGVDNAALRAFLSSDKATVGDPAKLPWCGDFVETCMKLGLPGEVFTGRVKENPYFARNWLDFGRECSPTYGAVVVFERGPASGHVAFLVGVDAVSYYTLGGNQSDGITVARIAASRALGFRWPNSVPIRSTPLTDMTPGNMKISDNEA